VSSDFCRPRLPSYIRQSRACARESTALTTKPPGGGEEAHRRWPEGRSERGASKAKQHPPGGTTAVSSDSRRPRLLSRKSTAQTEQRPPSRKIMFDFIPKNSETWA